LTDDPSVHPVNPVKHYHTVQSPTDIVITGVGILTAMGRGWRENADGFREGRNALRSIDLFSTEGQRVHHGGQAEVPDIGEIPIAENLPKRRAARADRPTRMLLTAADEAITASGIEREMLADGMLMLGTSAGAMMVGEEYFSEAHADRKGGQATRSHIYQPQVQAAVLAEACGIQRPAQIIANACASGANSIGHALQYIKTGRAEIAVAGGYDALAKLVFAGFDSLQALSTEDVPRPFDAKRQGLAIGEGAALFVIETRAHAEARGAGDKILATVAGYGATTDIHHLTQPNPEGDAALQSMTEACAMAGVTATDLEYINSHGTGTPLNDIAEGRAIQRFACDEVGTIAVSSTKASIGHLLGGAGAVEAAITVMALTEGFLPPTTTVIEPDEVCTFELIREPTNRNITTALTNSFGFGGANATVVLKKEVKSQSSKVISQ